MYAVVDIKDQGLGWVAQANIDRGTILLTDTRHEIAVSSDRKASGKSGKRDPVANAALSLAVVVRREAPGLLKRLSHRAATYRAILEAKQPLQGEFKSVEEQALATAKIEMNFWTTTKTCYVYEQISFINHACTPNAKLANDSVVSLRRIPKGEQITISYDPLIAKKHTKKRRAHLEKLCGFLCQCSSCS